MNQLFVTLSYLSIALISYVASSISWLALSLSSSSISTHRMPHVCKMLPGLNKRQIRFCRRNMDAMDSIRVGAKEAYSECQYQFQKRRWNCTMIDPVTSTVFGDVVLKEGTREAAFVHAISAAGVAYRITKDCSRGLIDKCGCDLSDDPKNNLEPSPAGTFSYRGCSDNVHYGIAVSADFVDAAERNKNQSQERRMMNEHNNRAGRQVLANSFRRECKCHGVSGACEMRTCWDAVPPFREIGNTIKDKFDGATEVKVVVPSQQPSATASDGGGGSGGAVMGARPRIERKNPMFKRHTPADLVYLDASPDYCEPDPERGVLGTRGRQCSISSLAIDGCDLLCCHRGYDRHIEIVQERCHCKFHYCCRVECQTCEKVVETYTCK